MVAFNEVLVSLNHEQSSPLGVSLHKYITQSLPGEKRLAINLTIAHNDFYHDWCDSATLITMMMTVAPV